MRDAMATMQGCRASNKAGGAAIAGRARGVEWSPTTGKKGSVVARGICGGGAARSVLALSTGGREFAYSSPAILEYASSSWSYAMTFRWYLIDTVVHPPQSGSFSSPVNFVAGSTKKSHWLSSP